MNRPLVILIALLLPQVVWSQTPAVLRPDADPRVERIVSAIETNRLRELLTALTAFGTRHTLSDTSSPTRGIGAAREWILTELRRSSPNLEVAFESFLLPAQDRLTRAVDLRNVVAVLRGRTSRRIYLTGHYDTVNIPGQTAGVARPTPLPAGFDVFRQPGQNFDVDAPGANDDGSGTVLTMELARLLANSGVTFDATLVFVLWAGEEQGHYGSLLHAQRLTAEGQAVEAMISNDIVGNSKGGNGVSDSASVRVYSEGPEDSKSRALARYVQRIAALYVPSHRVRLIARQDRFARGSDHQSFNKVGYPAVVFREAAENFARQHSASDTLDGVDVEYLRQNARVNAATVAALALAPAAPSLLSAEGQALIGREPGGYAANLRWVASPGAVAYRVFWRDGWATDWQHEQLLGNVTQFVLSGLSIDDVVIGVAAVGADGHESLISTYVAPPYRDVKVVGPQ
jgi:hypothetical protein